MLLEVKKGNFCHGNWSQNLFVVPGYIILLFLESLSRWEHFNDSAIPYDNKDMEFLCAVASPYLSFCTKHH